MPPTPGKVAATERNLPTRLRDAQVFGQISQPADAGPASFYTDGSVSRQPVGDRIGWMTGWGFLSTDGRYGCGKYPQFAGKVGDPAVVTELRAVRKVLRDGLAAGPITIITDSEAAAVVLRAWQSGSTDMPTGYTGTQAGRKVPQLELLRRDVAAHPAHLTVETVKGHAGIILNEAADALAQLGMRWARDDLTKDDVAARARSVAEGYLADYRRRR